jgi:ubiquinone/menaquinone biosynthesis C-methylase UbiE
MSNEHNETAEAIVRSLQKDPHHQGAWYLNPDNAKSYESFYEGKYKEADLLEKTALHELLNRFEGVKEILDAGCGTGHFTRWYESLGYHVVGADVSPVMLAVARELWNGELHVAPAEHLPFPDGSFDLVSMITCTEYMSDLGLVLAEVHRVARKGILLGIMNKWSLPTIRRIIQVKLGKNPFYTNATFRSLGTVKSLAKERLAGEAYRIHWICTAFPKLLPLQVAKFPFGAFLAVAIEFR